MKDRPSSQGSGHSVEESYDAVLDPILSKLAEDGVNFDRTIVYLPLKWCGHVHKNALDRYLDEETTLKYPNLIAQYHAPQTSEV